MPLTSSDLGSRISTPFQLVPGSQARIRTTNGAPLYCQPSWLMKDSWVNAATIATTAVGASHAGAGAAGTTSPTLAGTLCTSGVATFAYARNVVITVTHGSSIVGMTGVITGTDLYGKTITESWTITATGTSKTYTGAKAFKTVTAVSEIVAADASANTIIVGNGKKLGLSFLAANIKLVSEMEDNAAPTAGVIVAGSTASTADYRGTYAPNSTLNGALDFIIYYISDTPTDIGT